MPKTPPLDISDFLNTAANYLRGEQTPAAFFEDALARGVRERLADALAARTDNENRAVDDTDPYRQALKAMFDPHSTSPPARA